MIYRKTWTYFQKKKKEKKENKSFDSVDRLFFQSNKNNYRRQIRRRLFKTYNNEPDDQLVVSTNHVCWRSITWILLNISIERIKCYFPEKTLKLVRTVDGYNSFLQRIILPTQNAVYSLERTSCECKTTDLPPLGLLWIVRRRQKR